MQTRRTTQNNQLQKLLNNKKSENDGKNKKYGNG